MRTGAPEQAHGIFTREENVYDLGSGNFFSDSYKGLVGDNVKYTVNVREVREPLEYDVG